jgi:hypothetical protein
MKTGPVRICTSGITEPQRTCLAVSGFVWGFTNCWEIF